LNDLIEFLKSGKPDDLFGLVVKSVFGPGLVLALYSMYFFVTAWLDAGKAAVGIARSLGRARRHVESIPRLRLILALVSTIAVVCMELSWLFAVVVMLNITMFMTTASGNGSFENLFNPPSQEAMYNVPWLDLNIYAKWAILIEVLLMVLTAIFGERISELGWWTSISPVIIWWFMLILVAGIEVFVGKKDAIWHVVLLAIGLVYAGAGFLAFRAIRGVRSLWLARP
jgi:hypothetical protein